MNPDPRHPSSFKGIPRSIDVNELSGSMLAGLSLLDDELALPVAVLKASAIETNAAWMRRFLAKTGLSHAPHGKTTMSPQLIQRQLEDGAWAITAATAHHVRLYVAFGVRRILMANQLVGRANIKMVLALLRDLPDLDFYCLIDSPEAADQLADAACGMELNRPVQLLLELGSFGERCGVRSLADAHKVARAVAARSELSLRGVEAFEGVHSHASETGSVLALMMEAYEDFHEKGLFASGEIIVSAGGWAFPDIAANILKSSAASRLVRPVLRSGCYLTHDSEHYVRLFHDMKQRDPELAGLGEPRAALEVWSHIQSRPEATRAIASFGKRDVGMDCGMPIPLWTARPSGPLRPVSGGIHIAKLYDQHACLNVPAESDLRVGDLIGFGISHPCTTFDKWRALMLVDDTYRVIDIVHTCF
jgi:D-serine dehydratase